jgi:ADP-heptose:LPS heptosyltransferase
MRILVVQTTRMGDVLQTSPLVRTLRRAHPGAHIAMMCRKMGKPIAGRHPDIDDILLYEEDASFADLRSGDSMRLLRAHARTMEYVGRIRDGHYDLAYHCAPTVGTAMLLRMAGVPRVIGADLADDWHFLFRGAWTNYFFTSILHRDYSGFNLCDVFCNLADDCEPARELVFDIRDEDRAAVSELLARHGVNDDDFLACFQLGASENAKRWPEHRFAELSRMLREKHGAKVLLLGVDAEAVFLEAYQACDPAPSVPLFGKTNIPQLAALLERARVLVTNDTGTMHIAAAARCPVVLVSVGPVHFRETGPYGEGHHAIERQRQHISVDNTIPGEEQRDFITASQVMRAADRALGGDAPDDSAALDGVLLFRSAFAPDGCLDWYPCVRREPTETDFLRIAYRAMWIEHLRGREDARAERASWDRMLPCFSPPGAEVLSTWQRTLDAQFERLAADALQGIALTEQLRQIVTTGQRMAVAQEVVGKLTQIDEACRLFGEVMSPVRPLTCLASFERENLEGSDVEALTLRTLDIYRNLAARATLMRKKMAGLCLHWEGDSC